MRDWMAEITEAQKVGGLVRMRSRDWSQSTFLSLIGTLVDQRAADDGVSAIEMWDTLYEVAKTVNEQLGPMPTEV